MKMVIGISDWPEEIGKRFDIFPVKPGESDEDAIKRAKEAYDSSLECEIEHRIDEEVLRCARDIET